uniref:Uncharacterized protein n=1 Tax=Arundo donax TaxID=35708 RepID=A0A0A9BR98_ARUDO
MMFRLLNFYFKRFLYADTYMWLLIDRQGYFPICICMKTNKYSFTFNICVASISSHCRKRYRS